MKTFNSISLNIKKKRKREIEREREKERERERERKDTINSGWLNSISRWVSACKLIWLMQFVASVPTVDDFRGHWCGSGPKMWFLARTNWMCPVPVTTPPTPPTLLTPRFEPAVHWLFEPREFSELIAATNSVTIPQIHYSYSNHWLWFNQTSSKHQLIIFLTSMLSNESFQLQPILIIWKVNSTTSL